MVDDSHHTAPSDHTLEAQRRFLEESPMDWDDDADWVNARRGLVARPAPGVVEGP